MGSKKVHKLIGFLEKNPQKNLFSKLEKKVNNINIYRLNVCLQKNMGLFCVLTFPMAFVVYPVRHTAFLDNVKHLPKLYF